MFLTKLTCLIAATALSSCNPIFGVGSFIHSVATGNTVGIVTGGAGIAVKEDTGKSIFEHFTASQKEKEEPVIGKSIEWVFID